MKYISLITIALMGKFSKKGNGKFVSLIIVRLYLQLC